MNSLNFILFALELVIIQPNIECIPDCPQNFEIMNIYQRDLDLFESLIEESKNQISILTNGEGKSTYSTKIIFLPYFPIFMFRGWFLNKMSLKMPYKTIL